MNSLKKILTAVWRQIAIILALAEYENDQSTEGSAGKWKVFFHLYRLCCSSFAYELDLVF